jgi:TonB family protein
MQELHEYSNASTVLCPLQPKSYHVGKMERSWRSYLGSILAHLTAAALLLALSVPVAEHARRPAAAVSLIAPVLRAPISIPPPRRRLETKLTAPRTVLNPIAVPKLAAETPPRIAAVKPAPPAVEPIVEAPKAVNLEVPQHVPPPPVAELPVAPKVEVHVGSFEQTAASTGTSASRTVSVGAFDDGKSAQAGGGAHAAVHLGGFGDQTARPAESRPANRPEPNAYKSVEILFKPKPVYTKDARDSRVEGEVSLEVVFLATGEIRVGRVLHGLGHGLDEAAQQAAALVRFKPATRAGVPVDTPATIRITFELT